MAGPFDDTGSGPAQQEPPGFPNWDWAKSGHSCDDGIVAGESSRSLLFEESPLPSWVVDADGKVRAANGALAALIGRSIAELEGAAEAAFVASPETLRRADGSSVTVERSARSITWEGSPAELVVARDRTRELALVDARVEAAKMAALARFGGSLIHDVNNMLSVIMSYADFLVTDLEGHASIGDAKEIKEAGRRINELMLQLSGFSKPSGQAPTALDVHAELDALAGELGAAASPLVIERRWSARAPRIEVDRSAWVRALHALVDNAREASPAGGTLVLETADAEVSAEEAPLHEGAKPGSYVVIRVIDPGKGIDDAIRARIFEPFSTTKARAKGIGLGLSRVHGFARTSGGHVRVTSTPGHGATFALYLPRR
jgi:signal transduction histidine kinase